MAGAKSNGSGTRGGSTSWRTFLRAHWGAIAGADFFTTEVWTWRGLVTYYTVFVIDLASRRVQIVGSMPHPGELFMCQVGRSLTAAEVGLLRNHRVLICDRDRKWSGEVRRLLNQAGLRVVQTPLRAPNAHAYAERFVRSLNEECLDRIIPIGECHFRRAVSVFVAVTFINVDGFGRVKGHYGPGRPHPRQNDSETPSLTERGAWKPLSSMNLASRAGCCSAMSCCVSTPSKKNVCSSTWMNCPKNSSCAK